MEIEISQKAVLSLYDDVPVLLGIPSTSLQKLFKSNPIQSFKLGKHAVVLRSDLDAWLLQMREVSSCN